MKIFRSSKRIFLVIVFAGSMLGSFVDSVIAQSSTGISFGIRPTKALEGQEETFSYFSYRVSPGSVFDDEALVLNDGDEAVTLKIYAADGVTARNGGTDFTEFGGASTGASLGSHAWISLSVNEITLAPGEEQKIPFRVSIPADASAGQHIAGLVVEAIPEGSTLDSPDAADGEAQFNVKVIRRVGVAVVMDIPGEQISSLEIDNIFLYQQEEDGTTFAVDLRNTGNVFLQSSGFFVVTDRTAENLITTIPLQFDTILPGDAVTFYVPRAARFADGEYLLSVFLEHEGKKVVLEGVGMKIKNGQPELEGVVRENIFSPEEIEVFFADAEKEAGSVWITIAVASFVLAFILGGIIYWVGGKKEAKKSRHVLR